MKQKLVRRGGVAALATTAALAIGMTGTAQAGGPPGCPARDVSNYPMYYDYISSMYVGPGYLQRTYKEYYLGRYLGYTYCRA